MLNTNSYLVKYGENKESCSPDTNGYKDLIEGRVVFHNLFEWRWYKTTEYETNTFIKPESKENRGAADAKPQVAFFSSVRVADESNTNKE
mgnify:CR=1 FL=1